MKKISRRSFLEVAAGASAALALSACSDSSSTSTTTSTSTSSSTSSTDTAVSSEPVVLQFMTLSEGTALEAERKIIEMYTSEHENVSVEVTSVSGVDTFITAIKAKFSAGEEPDLYIYQAGTRTREFAGEDLLYDITGLPCLERVQQSDIEGYCTYGDGIYGVPYRSEFTGLFYNPAVLAEYGNVGVPENFQELIANCETLRANGLESPMVLAGKDIGNVSQVCFQYLSTIVSYQYPDYYQDLLNGDLKFSDDVFRTLFEKYGEIKEYTSADSLGVDNDEALKRFIRGEGAYWIAHGNTITSLRELMGDEFEFYMVPSVLQDAEDQRCFNLALCISIQVTASTEHINEISDLLDVMLSDEAGNIMAEDAQLMPAMVGLEALPDDSLEGAREYLDTLPRTAHADLIWVSGIKDVMKELTQEWYMGEDLDVILEEWESQHQRLLEANPDFVETYGQV